MKIDIILILAAVLSLSALIFALVAVLHKKMVTAVISAGAVSLTVSVIFLIMAAPDVAMTEAAIGSGLSTIIFFYALNRVRKGGYDG